MAWNRNKRSKYNAKKVEVDGIVFDSKREAKRYEELSSLEKVGAISNLKRQVKFVLIPTQREPDTIGKRGGIHKGKVIEHECAYIADFVYKDQDDKLIVEDTKGFRTPDYVIKRKLMLSNFNIRIQEI